MGDWENLPVELLAYLYSYLTRRDRLSCSLVCEQWRKGLDHVMLWKKVVVHIDTDLMDPSTILFTRDYCKHIKHLEFGWAEPYRNHKWTPIKYKELTKRATRLILILHDSYIQLNSLRIFNWFDFMSFQKITYHLSRLLRNQMSLKRIIFDNINMHSANYIKLLTSCLNSRKTIMCLDIRGCYYCQSSFDSVYFRSCIEQLSYLKTFKLDYFVLSCKLIDSIITSRNRCLEYLEVVIKETSWHERIIDDEQWCLLYSLCPNLKVTIIIRNTCCYGNLRIYLKQSIPLVAISMVMPRAIEKGDKCNFKKTLNLLMIYYHTTLETIELQIKNENEHLDETLLAMLRKCLKLKRFLFNGYLENPHRFQSTFSDIKYFTLPNSNMTVPEEVEEHPKRVQFTFQKRQNNTICSLFMLN